MIGAFIAIFESRRQSRKQAAETKIDRQHAAALRQAERQREVEDRETERLEAAASRALERQENADARREERIYEIFRELLPTIEDLVDGASKEAEYLKSLSPGPDRFTPLTASYSRALRTWKFLLDRLALVMTAEEAAELTDWRLAVQRSMDYAVLQDGMYRGIPRDAQDDLLRWRRGQTTLAEAAAVMRENPHS